MDVIFGDDDLDRLEVAPKFTGGRPPPVVKAYRKRMQTIRAAPDERDFYKLKSLRFEKLGGKRSHQHSMRLNDQFRLILELLKKDNPRGTVIKVVGIEDYH
ncbi:MAG TPA: plasmid maintenance system killer protein [Dehalococcoidia bacterium]|nr:plasmid maintenance system killer protein [Dehalococcoidia bacterium]